MLAACGPSATPAPAEPSPEPLAAAEPAVAEPPTTEPPASEPERVAEAPADEVPSDATTGPRAPTSSTPAAPGDGCTFTPNPGVVSPGGISILGLAEGGDGYDMPQICPMQACSSGLTIELPKRGDWQFGVYDVVVAVDSGTFRCHLTRTPPPAWRQPARCAHVRELTADCVGPADFHPGPIMISGAPAKVRVAIEHDGVALADQTLRPSYSNKRWDGWDCDPSCTSAEASVSVK